MDKGHILCRILTGPGLADWGVIPLLTTTRERGVFDASECGAGFHAFDGGSVSVVFIDLVTCGIGNAQSTVLSDVWGRAFHSLLYPPARKGSDRYLVGEKSLAE